MPTVQTDINLESRALLFPVDLLDKARRHRDIDLLPDEKLDVGAKVACLKVLIAESFTSFEDSVREPRVPCYDCGDGLTTMDYVVHSPNNTYGLCRECYKTP